MIWVNVMNREVFRNAENYIDTTAGKAITNVMKGENMQHFLRGEIYEYISASGISKNALIVANNDRIDDMYISIIVLHDNPAGEYSVPVVCGTQKYARCNTVSYADRRNLYGFIKKATDDEMYNVDCGIIKALGIENKFNHDTQITKNVIIEKESDETKIYTAILETERDLYKQLYEQMVEKMLTR